MAPLALTSEHFIFHGHPTIWDTIAAHIKIKKFSKGDNVICHGDEAQSFFIVLHGWVSLTRQTPDGKETIVGLCTEEDVFGEAALFPNASYPYNALTVSPDAEVVLIPSKTMRDIIQTNKEFSSHVMGLLNDRLAKTQLKLEQLSTLSAAQRMGCFLLKQCKNQSHGSKTIPMPVEKHIIAAYLGMKPETFSRSLQQLKDVGIKTAGSEITVTNIEDLREYVCGSCSESGFCETETAVML